MSVIEDAVEMIVKMSFMCLDSKLPSHGFQGRQSPISSQLRRSELKFFSLIIL